jgi:D-alanyl-D-alanine carboxypeptidase
MDLHRRAVVGLGLAGAGLAAASHAAADAAVSPSAMSLEGAGRDRYAAAMEDIGAYAARHMAAYGLPGLTLAAVAPGGIAGFMRFGYSDVGARTPIRPDQLFQVGSISKSFTAICIFQLVEAGRLRLDSDARDLLPGAPWPAGRTTVQSLLNHSSGLPDDAPLFPRGGDERLWRGFTPGARWSYSNLGFRILGDIVERLDGEPLAAALERRILRPLGMTATRGAILTGDRALYADGHSAFYPDRAYPRAGPLGPGAWTDMTAGAGCVASTAGDMSRYCRWLIAAGRGRGAPLLSDAAAARFTAPTIEAPGWGLPGAKYANGLAVVDVGGRPLLHHTGGMLAFNSSIHADPQAGVAAFATTNVGLVPYRPRDITAYACERLRAVVEGGPAPLPPAAPPRAVNMADYLGSYEASGGRRLAVLAASPGLAVQLGERAWPFEPVAPDVFAAADPSVTPDPLVFRRTGKAVVRAWHGGSEYVRVENGRPVAPFSPATPPALTALTGHYVCDDPWAGGFRVTAQGAALFLEDITPLAALPGGGFRVGEEDWSPERLRFEALLDGRPQRAVRSGVDYLRRPA